VPNLFEQASPIARAEYEILANRISQLAILYMQHPELIDKPLGRTFPDLWVGKTLLRCEIQAIGNVLIEKGIITADELLAKYSEAIELFLSHRERELGCIIAVDGVYVPEDSPLNKGESCQSTQEGPQSLPSASPKEPTPDSTSNTNQG